MILNGCSPVSMPPIKQYNIDSVANKRLVQQPSNHSLIVATPISASGYDKEDMLYVKKPFQLQAFAQNAWLAPPAEMLSSVLVNSLQNSGYFRAVVEPPYVGRTRFRLNTTLLELKQSFLQQPSEIVLTLKVDLVDLNRGVAIASKRFHERRKTQMDTPYGGVLAANMATRSLMERVSAFVVRACQRYA